MTSGFYNISYDEGPLEIATSATKSIVEDEGTVENEPSGSLDLKC